MTRACTANLFLPYVLHEGCVYNLQRSRCHWSDVVLLTKQTSWFKSCQNWALSYTRGTSLAACSGIHLFWGSPVGISVSYFRLVGPQKLIAGVIGWFWKCDHDRWLQKVLRDTYSWTGHWRSSRTCVCWLLFCDGGRRKQQPDSCYCHDA